MGPALIVSEATAGFEVAVAAAVGSAGLPIAVVNPRQMLVMLNAILSDRKPWQEARVEEARVAA